MSDPRPGPLLHPRGPLPGTVYWRRRLVLGAAVVLVLLLLGRACGSGDDAPDTGATGTTGTTGVTGTPGPTAPAAPGPTGPAVPTPEPAAPPAPTTAPAEPVDCTPADIAIGLEPDPAGYPVGGPVPLPVTVAVRGEQTCRLDVGPGSLQVVLLSGGDRVWARQDCESQGREVVTLAPGAPVAAGVSWDGQRSAPGCPASAGEARAGTYRAVVTVLGVSTPEVPFTLR